MAYYNPYNQQANYTPTQNNALVWVQGEAGAKSYLMAPNSTALLMDAEASKMYIKATDAAGMPTLRIFEYTELTQKEPTTYPTMAEFEELKARVEELTKKEKKDAKSDI